MPPRRAWWLAPLLPLLAAACDDPTPIVLGRLNVATDAGHPETGHDAEAQVHERDRETREREGDERDDASESDRP